MILSLAQKFINFKPKGILEGKLNRMESSSDIKPKKLDFSDVETTVKTRKSRTTQAVSRSATSVRRSKRLRKVPKNLSMLEFELEKLPPSLSPTPEPVTSIKKFKFRPFPLRC